MISVCVATYNGEKYIKQQLLSILSQLTLTDEVIVSDDGSTDNTCSIIESLNDYRIRLYHNDFHSCRLNFQFAMQQAQGDIIFLSDQDDVWLENKVKLCMKELEHYDLVVTNSYETNETLDIVNKSFFNKYHSGRGILKNIFCNTYYGSCMVFKRDLLSDALPLPETKEIGHDLWLGLVAEMNGKKVLFMQEPLLLYRRHSQTATTTTSLLKRSNRNLITKIWSRVIIIYNVLKYMLNNGKRTR